MNLENNPFGLSLLGNTFYKQEHTLLQLQFALQEQALPLQLHWAVHPKALVVVPFDLQATVLQQ